VHLQARAGLRVTVHGKAADGSKGG
jgi:anthranilate phosphoribosyltransferase